MSDGHSGIENRKLKEGGSGGFHLTLSYLKEANGRGLFVIHARSNVFSFSGLQPTKFLNEIGFQHFNGQCPFYGDGCFYTVRAMLQRTHDGFDNFEQTERIHQGFQKFANEMDQLFRLRNQEDDILVEVGMQRQGRPIFGSPEEIVIAETDMPLWVEAVKYPRLRELEAERDKLDAQIAELRVLLPLTYGTGDALEDSVAVALQLLGLKVTKAPKGFTADILAQTPDESRRFGVEVTGISEAVKKNSRKLTQVLDFERVKEDDQKTILIANTHKDTPPDQREGQDDFTAEVLNFLSPYPILLMTGLDLYRMVGDVLEGNKTAEELVDLLYQSCGQLKYLS